MRAQQARRAARSGAARRRARGKQAGHAGLWLALGLVGALLFGPFGIAILGAAALDDEESTANAMGSGLRGGGGTGRMVATGHADVPPLCIANTKGIRLSREQIDNAAIIIATGKADGLPRRAWVIAVATARQESSLRVLNYGDEAGPDSRGLFQQRDSWGPLEERMDPVSSSRLFYRELKKVRGWESMRLTDAAQAVQISGEPEAYQKHESQAEVLVSRAGECAESSTAWRSPVSRYRLSGRFGEGGPHWKRGHTGLDFAAAQGLSVRSVSGGTVTAVMWSDSYGNLVKVRSDRQTELWYAHLLRTEVTAGQHVTAGTPLGAVGSTGNSTGPHLHLEVRVNGKPTDPAKQLARHGVSLARGA